MSPVFRPFCTYAPRVQMREDPRNFLRRIQDDTVIWCNRIRDILNLPYRVHVWASPGMRNFLSVPGSPQYGDEFILWDNIFAYHILNDRRFGYYALVGILAHELGHVKNRQYSSFPFRGWGEEQQADFYAGYSLKCLDVRDRGFENFLYCQQGFNGSYPPGHVRVSRVQRGYEYHNINW